MCRLFKKRTIEVGIEETNDDEGLIWIKAMDKNIHKLVI
jgi:hypothetical protein